MSEVVGIGPEWDWSQCRLDGLNGLLLHCRDSMCEDKRLSKLGLHALKFRRMSGDLFETVS